MNSFGTLLSVNVGRAALLAAQGETIVSGFVKLPVATAQRVEAGGLLSDDHVDDVADPDRAVLLYQRSHYDAWSAELGRELGPGMFGEQLTVEAPLENEVCVGDQLQVGDVVLEVTQPRIPCRKMAVRLELEDMPMRYMRSGRTGFFCKVLTPGALRAGQPIELLRRGPDNLTVARLAALLPLAEPEAAELDRVLSATVLPALVRAKLEKLQARLAERATGWMGDRELHVADRTAESSDIVSFDLVDPAGKALPAFAAGQFLTLVLNVAGESRPVVRTYTLAGRSADGSGYQVAVKREPAPAHAPDVAPGLASAHMHDVIPVGARLLARAPRGRFVLRPGTKPVVLVSAGIGITPMLAMLEAIVSGGGVAASAGCGLSPDPVEGPTASAVRPREVHFVHGARSSKELAFGSRVQDLVARGENAHGYLLFSRPGGSDRLGTDFDLAGRVTAAGLAALLPGLDADFYVCGPSGFMADIVSGLLALGVPEDQVHYEFFGAARSLLGDAAGAEAGPEILDEQGRPILVTFARSGLTVPWRKNVFSLLALAESAGLRPDASCRTGLCSTCVTRIDGGEIDYAIEPMDPVDSGMVAVCCARPRTSVMLDL